MTELKPSEWDHHGCRQVGKGLALANTSFVKVYKADISTVHFDITVSFIIKSVNLHDPTHTSGCSLMGTLCRPKMTLDLAENLWIPPRCQTVAEAFFYFSIITVQCLFANNKIRRIYQIWKHNATFSPVLSVSLFSLYLSF